MQIVLLHGLTATRDYVVHGSRVLERAGHEVIRYDARGHGAAPPASGYDYPGLADDLAGAFAGRAVLAGASMGAHTIAAFAQRWPERVAAAVLITPAFDPEAEPAFEHWDARARALREGGVEGFLDAMRPFTSPPQWHPVIERVVRARMSAHRHPGAVADALEQVPRSRPFAAWADLASAFAVTVVASRDEADPEHPLATGERWAQATGGELVVEAEGESLLAWRGGQLSRLIADVAGRASG